jgi:hypothetical protein
LTLLLLTCLAAIGAGKWQPEVIGDFEQSHARGYLQWKLAQKDSSIVVDDDAWAKVYEVRQALWRPLHSVAVCSGRPPVLVSPVFWFRHCSGFTGVLVLPLGCCNRCAGETLGT